MAAAGSLGVDNGGGQLTGPFKIHLIFQLGRLGDILEGNILIGCQMNSNNGTMRFSIFIPSLCVIFQYNHLLSQSAGLITIRFIFRFFSLRTT